MSEEKIDLAGLGVNVHLSDSVDMAGAVNIAIPEYQKRIAEKDAEIAGLRGAIIAVVKDADRVQGWFEVNRDEFLAMAEIVGVYPDE